MRHGVGGRAAVALMAMCLTPALAIAFAFRQSAGALCSSDAGLFAVPARALTSGRLTDVYADSVNQAGPVELLITRLTVAPTADCAAGAAGWPLIAAAALLCAAVAVVAFAAASRAIGGRAVGVASSLAAAAAVGGALPLVLRFGHPAGLLVPAAWIAAAALVHRRPLLAGAVVGLAAGVETWGVLGVALLAAAPTARSRVGGAAVAAGVGAAWYVPFLLSGRFAMGDLVWPTWQTTIAHLLVGDDMSWAWRLAQGAVVVAVGAAASWRLRHSPRHLVWAGPAAVLSTRLLTDPVSFHYYWAMVVVVGICALLAAWGSDLRDQRAPIVAAAAAVLAHGLLPAALYLPVGVLLAAALLAPKGRPEPAGNAIGQRLRTPSSVPVTGPVA